MTERIPTLINSTYMSWCDLQKKYHFVKDIYSSEKIWERIDSDPISPAFISWLYRNGHRVIINGKLSSYDAKKKLITISKGFSEGFDRDCTLFHEIAHAKYDNDDNNRPFGRNYEYRELVIEFVGRKLRADPELLKFTVLTFNLEPQVYDLTSFIAFGQIMHPEICNFLTGKQPPLPFLDPLLNEFLQNISKIKME